MNRCRRAARFSDRAAFAWCGHAGPPSLAQSRHGFLERAPSRAAEQFERLQPAVQPDIIAAIFDDVAGVRNGGAVAVENLAYGFEAQFETSMGQIHRDLPGK